MSDELAFQASLRSFAQAVKRNLEMTEQEVYDNLVGSRFFTVLGYEGSGVDIRSQQPIRGFEPDYYCLDAFEKTIFVIELKKPADDQKSRLEEYRDKQLSEKYVNPLKARHGILTNGVRFILYERVGQRLVERARYPDLSTITEEQATELYQKLRKPTVDLTILSEVTSRIKESIQEPKDLSVETSQRDFFHIFKLDDKSKFGELVRALDGLLEYCLTDKAYKFTNGAYAFWKKSYAIELEDIPKPWRPFTTMKTLEHFMFCLETAHALVSRLILAKVSEDFRLPGVGMLSELESDIERYSYRGRTSLTAYSLAVKEVLSRLHDVLVESIFEEDLFTWWHDSLRELDVTRPKELTEIKNAYLERFGKSLIEVVIALYAFDFRGVEDIIGDLYQEYFDKDTRKALGEFYTPTPIVDYILDKVDYQGIPNQRLVDLSCGSGTFVVQALRRFLQRSSRAASQSGWDHILDNLCNEPKIVGFDLNPFAALMAQVRYMIELVPYYKKAIEADQHYTLKTIPIFMTDSLWSEKAIAVSGQTQIVGFTEVGGDIIFSFELPVQESPGKFVRVELSMPTRDRLELDNVDQHFLVLRSLFSQIKKKAGKRQYTVDPEFERGLSDLLTKTEIANPTRIVNDLKPYAEKILSKIEELNEKYDDGRLIKSMEDRVLAGVLKNYVSFDYVVGNPPWVSKKTKRIFLSDAYQADLIKLYESANADFDLHVPFIERGLTMLKKEGRLGYIVSNTFFKTAYGETIRAILTQNRLLHVVDFGDYDVFEEPTNYSAILIVERSEEKTLYSPKINDGWTVDCARVCFWSPDLEGLMKKLREGRSSRDVDIFELDKSHLSSLVQTQQNDTVDLVEIAPSKAKVKKKIPVSDVWVIAPKAELALMRKLEKLTKTRLGTCEVIRDGRREKYVSKTANFESNQAVLSDRIFVGIQLDGKGIFAPRPVEKLTIEEILGREKVVVESTDFPGREWTLETKALRFLIDGKHVTRWLSDWEQELVVFPYEEKNGDFNLIPPTKLHQNFPGVYNYLRDAEVLRALDEASAERHELHKELMKRFRVTTFEELSQRLADPDEVERLGEHLYWYRSMRRQNIESVDAPKIMVCTTATHNRFSGDLDGILAPHNVRVYSIVTEKKNIPFALSILNSKLFAFYLNHVAVMKKGKTFEYIKQCLSLFPIKLPASVTDMRFAERMTNMAKSCMELRRLQQKVERFPDSYLAEFGETEVDRLVHRFRRDHVEGRADLQPKLSGNQFDINMGDSETIESEFLTSQMKAKYAKTCIDGRSYRRDEKLVIPIPRDDSVCEELMRKLGRDRASNPQEEIDKLQKENDACVFLYYKLNRKERAIVEDYVSRFSAEYVKTREEQLRKKPGPSTPFKLFEATTNQHSGRWLW